MKIFFSFIVIIHGLIHLLGFAKAFGLGNITQLSKEISKPLGLLWLTTFLLFLIALILFILKKEQWCFIGIIAIIISQVLIFVVWQDAKFGTIINVFILLITILAWGNIHFEKSFRNDVEVNLDRIKTLSTELLTEADLKHLPTPVQLYLRYAGVINKPKVNNFRVTLEGEMRDKGKEYFPFISEQYNFIDKPTRLFFMKGKMFGLIVPGYHKYSNAKAKMDIRLFGLFSIVKHSGEIMDKTETVTLFNDMCLLAPATLIDKRIKWKTINDAIVKANFSNQNITISAKLCFNNQGQLINFFSEDRTAVADMKQYLFSTPIYEYKKIKGINLMSYGEAVWHYPDGKFIYGKFKLKDIEYNYK